MIIHHNLYVIMFGSQLFFSFALPSESCLASQHEPSGDVASDVGHKIRPKRSERCSTPVG